MGTQLPQDVMWLLEAANDIGGDDMSDGAWQAYLEDTARTWLADPEIHPSGFKAQDYDEHYFGHEAFMAWVEWHVDKHEED